MCVLSSVLTFESVWGDGTVLIPPPQKSYKVGTEELLKGRMLEESTCRAELRPKRKRALLAWSWSELEGRPCGDRTASWTQLLLPKGIATTAGVKQLWNQEPVPNVCGHSLPPCIRVLQRNRINWMCVYIQKEIYGIVSCDSRGWQVKKICRMDHKLETQESYYSCSGLKAGCCRTRKSQYRRWNLKAAEEFFLTRGRPVFLLYVGLQLI